MSYEQNNDRNSETIYSKRLKAGKRRTYFFDVRATKGNDYFITLTESKKKFNDSGYERHKIFLYKEDFNKFVKALNETVDHVKTQLMPDYDFDAFNHEFPEGEEYNGDHVGEQRTDAFIERTNDNQFQESSIPSVDGSGDVDKW